jgi:hypothetical protein
MGRIGRDAAAGDEPVEQHPDRSQVLLDRRLLVIFLQAFDIGCEMERFEIIECSELVLIAPA